MGNDDNFTSFIQGHGRRLVHLAELLTGDRHVAEDLVQDVLARAYPRWQRLERDDPYAYLRQSLINARTDRWRRRLPVPMERPPENRAVPDHAVAIAERDVVLRALRDLTGRERCVIALRYYEDLTEAQTAKALGITVGTVKSTTSRALRKLREHPAVELGLQEELR
jgi:RNA polymerase sigma-70 factor (sigma-E family)